MSETWNCTYIQCFPCAIIGIFFWRVCQTTNNFLEHSWSKLEQEFQARDAGFVEYSPATCETNSFTALTPPKINRTREYLQDWQLIVLLSLLNHRSCLIFDIGSHLHQKSFRCGSFYKALLQRFHVLAVIQKECPIMFRIIVYLESTENNNYFQ